MAGFGEDRYLQASDRSVVEEDVVTSSHCDIDVEVGGFWWNMTLMLYKFESFSHTEYEPRASLYTVRSHNSYNYCVRRSG